MVYSPGWNFAQTSGTSPSRQRPHNGGNTARYPTQPGKPAKLGHPLQHQPENGGQAAQAPRRPGCAQGPEPVSTGLGAEQEAIAGAFRRHTLLPLDDCLDARQATIPHLSRSALHRCFQRHGIRRLPLSENGQSPQRSNSRTTPSATCTSILPKYRPKKASRTSSWPLTAPEKWRLSSCIRGPNGSSRPGFCGACSTSYPIKCIRS